MANGNWVGTWRIMFNTPLGAALLLDESKPGEFDLTDASKPDQVMYKFSTLPLSNIAPWWNDCKFFVSGSTALLPPPGGAGLPSAPYAAFDPQQGLPQTTIGDYQKVAKKASIIATTERLIGSTTALIGKNARTVYLTLYRIGGVVTPDNGQPPNKDFLIAKFHDPGAGGGGVGDGTAVGSKRVP